MFPSATYKSEIVLSNCKLVIGRFAASYYAESRLRCLPLDAGESRGGGREEGREEGGGGERDGKESMDER